MTTSRKSFSGDVQVAWDATSLKAFDECPRKYQYTILEGWEPATRSPHLLFGSAFANALEGYYKKIAAGSTPADALRAVVRTALTETWFHRMDSDGIPIPHSGGRWVSDNPKKTRETLIRSIIWYFEEFSHDTMEIFRLADGTPALELSFSFEAEEDIILCGHLDRVVTFAGSTYIMDQKTTGTTVSPRYFSQFDLDIQMSMYSFAGKSQFALPLAGVIIDAIQINVGSTRFERGFTFRTDAQLQEWYTDTIGLIRTAQAAARRGYFPKRPASCGNWGGCPFKTICSKSPEVRQSYLETDFTPRESLWDPIERR